jgi:hypothetical protein
MQPRANTRAELGDAEKQYAHSFPPLLYYSTSIQEWTEGTQISRKEWTSA